VMLEWGECQTEHRHVQQIHRDCRHDGHRYWQEFIPRRRALPCLGDRLRIAERGRANTMCPGRVLKPTFPRLERRPPGPRHGGRHTAAVRLTSIPLPLPVRGCELSFLPLFTAAPPPMHGYRPLYEATMRQREFTAFRGSAAAAAANEACFSFGNGCQAIQIAR